MIQAAHAASLAGISAGWKLLAILIGLAVVVLIWLIAAIPTRGRLWQLVDGADRRPSTSKFQWLLWLAAVVFGYSVLWVLRARQGDYSAISDIPVNLLTVLGLSTGTAAIAKGITAGYVQSNRVAQPLAVTHAKGGLIQDDSGVPDLGKLQLMAFTLIAIGIYLATLIHQVVSNPVITTMPNIDSSLLVLMGISQGGYIGKKLVTFNTPVLYPVAAASAGASVTVSGANLGTPAAGSAPPTGAQLLLDDTPVPTTDWSPTTITFTVPADKKAGSARLAVIVAGQKSNTEQLTVSQAVAAPPAGASLTQPALTGAAG